MAREVVVTREAFVELLEEVNSIAAFDVAAAIELEQSFSAALDAISENPKMYPIGVESASYQYRRFAIKSRVVVYTEVGDSVIVVRVFGPGEDWQSDLSG
ncbi:MAG: type II toxin-antitoxin system RelE/ParE family toxin [Planctomycetes bacterium]|nr:type II toxin-antitoxin system RelE/ParE family toxin [Planctomycetota bacterium]